MRRLLLATAASATLLAALFLSAPSEASACAGLIGSNGAVNLGRTTTLAAYHDGVEHYVTSFEFLGGGGEFGTLIPLPGVPTKVERGGEWTLQRLQLETQPPRAAAGDVRLASAAAPAEARVLLETRIDALDITVLEGGGPAVAAWARKHGFRLSPDAPEVLDFYAARSPIFLAAVFDGAATAERGQAVGDGTPVHLTIPTANPWVPLRILGLGKQPGDRVQADVFLLTDAQPALLPQPRAGLTLAHSRSATAQLLDDLRSDAGMAWVPASAWLTKLQVNRAAGDLRYDLAVGTRSGERPSAVAAGLAAPPVVAATSTPPPAAAAATARPTVAATPPAAVAAPTPAPIVATDTLPVASVSLTIEQLIGAGGVSPATTRPEPGNAAPDALRWWLPAAAVGIALAAVAWRFRGALLHRKSS